MKRLFIVVEGHTEEEFVKSMIAPYLATFEIYDVRAIKIRTSRTSKGGFVNFDHLKNTVKPLLLSEGEDAIVTTFVDFFRIPTDIPSYDQCISKHSKQEQVSSLESAIGAVFNDSRFVPYIQLHEFEALLFSSPVGFQRLWDRDMFDKADKIVRAFENPEDINSSPQSAPSKRILAINHRYDKVIEGNIIAMDIGIEAMLDRCPRFRCWMNDIKDKMK